MMTYNRQSVLEATPDAGKVRLVICEGRLGLEWLARIETPKTLAHQSIIV